ncbi:MAG: PHP domain-containing protein [Ignavibacteriales bacterium]|nr:PHP domain-containing protein [Ignavibacteriales bacterium]
MRFLQFFIARFIFSTGLVLVFPAAVWLSPSIQAQESPLRFELPPPVAGSRWFKGNTHTHTLESDGDSPPETVIRWYRANRYDFLVISDHNVWVDPSRFANLIDSTFILIPGEEITSGFARKPVHVNGLNIPHVIEPRTDTTLLGTIQKNVDAVREVAGVPHINHPNFHWAFDHEVLAHVKNDKLLEIFNGHPLVHNVGGGDSPGMEEIWDRLLSGGKRVYGIAVDDAHHFTGEFAPHRSNPGRGWVVVRAARLEGHEILENMEKGLFYASTGVELDDVIVQDQQIEISIRQKGNFKYRTDFIGGNGAILSSTGSNSARYQLSHPTAYVRAKITDSGGAVAWVQPIFVQQ